MFSKAYNSSMMMPMCEMMMRLTPICVLRMC